MGFRRIATHALWSCVTRHTCSCAADALLWRCQLLADADALLSSSLPHLEGDNRWEKGSTRRALAASERRVERCAAAASSGPLSMLPPSLRTEKDAAAHLGKGARMAKPIPCSCSPPRPNPPWVCCCYPRSRRTQRRAPSRGGASAAGPNPCPRGPPRPRSPYWRMAGVMKDSNLRVHSTPPSRIAQFRFRRHGERDKEDRGSRGWIPAHKLLCGECAAVSFVCEGGGRLLKALLVVARRLTPFSLATGARRVLPSSIGCRPQDGEKRGGC